MLLHFETKLQVLNMSSFLFIRIGIQSLAISVSQTSLLVGPFRLRKITKDPHILVHVNTECPDDRYPKFNIYISEMTLAS